MQGDVQRRFALVIAQRHVGTGAQQLESIEQLVEEHSGGLLASDAGLQSKLHKLAGSSLQAGAYRLGMHLKQLKTATPPPSEGAIRS